MARVQTSLAIRRGCLAVAVLRAHTGAGPLGGRAFGGAILSVTDVMGGTNAVSGAARRDAGTSRAGMDYTPPVRTGAFRAAGRHTARVRFLRRAIVLGAVFSVSVISIVALFDPFRHLPTGLSISGVGVKGTKITLQSPKLTGVQQGGGAYRIEAKSSVQDITAPSVIELFGVDTHIGMADKTTTHVVSNRGLYDSKQDTFKLDGDVKIENTSGYTFGLKSALLDFKRGTLTSEQRMRVDIKGGDVIADGVTITNNGHVLLFKGHVESTFETEEPPQTTADATPAEITPAAEATPPAGATEEEVSR